MTKKLRFGPACYHVLHLIPIMVAHEMNFFYDEGLHDEDGQPNYEIVPGGLAPFTFEMETLGQRMKEQGMDIAMDAHPSTIVYLNRRGHELFIVAGWRNQHPVHVVARPPIKTLTDLKGKRIGLIDQKDNNYLHLSPWLRRAGLDHDRDVQWVRAVPPERAPDALRAGEVDAAFCHIQDVLGLERDGFVHLMDLKSSYKEGRPDRIIAATERALQEKPEMVKACLRGMIRAYWYMRQQPETHLQVLNLERRLRRQSPDPDEQRRKPSCFSPSHMEHLPFPYDGKATGLATYVQEWVELGFLQPADADHLEKAVRQDVVEEAFRDLSRRPELQEDLARAKAVHTRLGY